MFDPISIAGLSRAASGLYSLADQIVSSGSADAGKVIELCNRVGGLLETISGQLASDTPQGMERRAEELKQWVRLGVGGLGAAIPQETKDELSSSLLGIADKLDSAHLSTATPEERRAVAVQLDRCAGQLAGLADVLGFQAGPSPRQQTRGPGVLGSWASDTLATMAGFASIAIIAAGTEKIPVVGPTLASLIQGEVPNSASENDA